MIKTLTIAAMLALPGAALAQTAPADPPVEPLEWELDTEALREGLLALGQADPAAQDPQTKAQLLALRESLGNLKTALGDGPEADATLKVLQDIGTSELQPSPAQLAKLGMGLRKAMTDATPEERERAMTALTWLQAQGSGGDPLSVLMRDFGNADTAAALGMLQNLGTDGAEGRSTVLSQEALDVARAFGATGGNGDAALAEEHVRRLLAGEEAKPDE